MTTDATPNTFQAELFEVGDRFAFTIQPHAEYEIYGRTIDGSDNIQFQVRRSNEGGAEPIEYTMTFPVDMPLESRRRIRKHTKKCMLCPELHTVEIDTAYGTLGAVVCRNH